MKFELWMLAIGHSIQKCSNRNQMVPLKQSGIPDEGCSETKF